MSKGTISQSTAERIWVCYREIQAAENMLAELKKNMSDVKFSSDSPSPKDAFGRSRDYQLGIPSGDSGHRLYNVRPELALSIMRAHIAEKTRELTEANEQARIELDTV